MSPTTRESSDDLLPVDDAEHLLRRFPNEPDQFDFTLLVPRLNAFLPSIRDVDGLSLNREGAKYTNAEEMLAAAPSEKMRLSGGVVAVLAQKVRQHEMTVNPSPTDSPGHVIIKEINRREYDAVLADGSKPGKQKIKAVADRLARIAEIRIPPKPKT